MSDARERLMERLGSYEYADALDAFLAHPDTLIACLVESGALGDGIGVNAKGAVVPLHRAGWTCVVGAKNVRPAAPPEGTDADGGTT